jgi:hypothetical protein
MATYEAIATVNVGSGGVGTISFTSIPQTYTDLLVLCSFRSSSVSGVDIRPNGSSSNGSNRRLYTNASVVASFSGSTIFLYHNRNTYTADVFDNSQVYISNYTSANFKSISIDNVTETNATAIDSQLQAGLWSQASAITSLDLVDQSGTFVQYSSATLYGIKKN